MSANTPIAARSSGKSSSRSLAAFPCFAISEVANITVSVLTKDVYSDFTKNLTVNIIEPDPLWFNFTVNGTKTPKSTIYYDAVENLVAGGTMTLVKKQGETDYTGYTSKFSSGDCDLTGKTVCLKAMSIKPPKPYNPKDGHTVGR